jgi:hypothetical protein
VCNYLHALIYPNGRLSQALQKLLLLSVILRYLRLLSDPRIGVVFVLTNLDMDATSVVHPSMLA